ncbi:dynein axonemal heavy chain 17-like [Phycodurus eques]|uniref:dynein axonemal heavy chain 17-like n=1 Tax=Phycodurus eques TaxID=693459 RepID=UPI002ACF0163|nr:dynein axonemal heavy chain 17-like [Phycodurus eques]
MKLCCRNTFNSCGKAFDKVRRSDFLPSPLFQEHIWEVPHREGSESTQRCSAGSRSGLRAAGQSRSSTPDSLIRPSLDGPRVVRRCADASRREGGIRKPYDVFNGARVMFKTDPRGNRVVRDTEGKSEDSFRPESRLYGALSKNADRAAGEGVAGRSKDRSLVPDSPPKTRDAVCFPEQEVYRVRLQFQLEQVVVAGGRGRMWTAVVEGVCRDFLRQLQFLSDCEYDAGEPADQSFPEQASSFQEHVSHLEARLVSILRGTLDECYLPSAAVKVVNVFGPLLQRPAVRDRLRSQLSRLVELVLKELDQVRALVKSKSKKDVSSKFRSSPAVTLRWAQQLMLRAHNVLHSFQTVQHLCAESCETVRQKFQTIADLLLDIRSSVRQEWSRQLDRDAAAALQLPLIRQQQSTLGIPCGQKLEALLSDLKQASWEKDLELRPQVADILQRRRDIGKSYLSLTNIVASYNQVVGGALPAELPLIQDGLEEQRRSLLELRNSTWTSKGVHELIEKKRRSLDVFFASVNEARGNMAAMRDITQGWAGLPLLHRSGHFLERGGATEESYTRVREDGDRVIRLTAENSVLYGVQDQTSPVWLAYLDHVDQMVQDGVLQMLLHSLNFLSQNMTPTSFGGALLQVLLQLQLTGSVFDPSLTSDLTEVLKSFIADIHAAAGLPPRVSAARQGNYQEALRDDAELAALEKEVMLRLQEANEEAERLRADLDRFSPLWQSHKRTVMDDFLKYGRQLEEGEEDVEEAPPTLADFQREIHALQKQLREVNELEDYDLVHGWLQVDLQPFKDALRLFINNWISLYTQHLLKLVRQSMSRRSVDDEDEEAEKSSARHFPLTETIMLLETVNVEVPELTTLLQTGGHLVADTEVKEAQRR